MQREEEEGSPQRFAVIRKPAAAVIVTECSSRTPVCVHIGECIRHATVNYAHIAACDACCQILSSPLGARESYTF